MHSDCETCGPIEVHYYRSRSGEMVHRAECARRGKRSLEWHYATRQLAADHGRVLAEIAAIPWLKACAYCMSVDEAAEVSA